MQQQQCNVEVNGRAFPLFARVQLESMNPRILRTRALNLKEATGMDIAVPRHPEMLTDWILDMQSRLTGANSAPMPAAPARRADAEYRAAPFAVDDPAMHQKWAALRAQPDRRITPSECGESDAGSCYSEARSAREASRSRNAGSGNILSWA